MFRDLWEHATLWQDPESGSLLALSGRLQLDSYWFSADSDDVSPGADDHANDTTWRRFRFGFLSRLGGVYTIHLEADLDLNNKLGKQYNRLTDAYVGYSPGSAWNIKLLKQSVGYTLDGATSSKRLLTLQRNNLTNNLWATDEYFSGLHIGGSVDDWSYRAGLFSGDDSEEIGLDNVGYFTLLSIGYSLADRLSLDEALIRVDYVFNDKHHDEQAGKGSDYDNNATPDFRHTGSLVTEWQKGAWGLRTGTSVGQGLALQSNMWGLVVMPFYSFTPRQQLVLRYTYLDSDGENGLTLGRYENQIVSGEGDRYNEIYFGYNLFIYGQKLKWQTGIQFAKMQDRADDGGKYAGWGLTTGLRTYW